MIHLQPPTGAKHITPESRADGLALLREMNAAHAAEQVVDAPSGKMAYIANSRMHIAPPERISVAAMYSTYIQPGPAMAQA
jgi:hypothetical protein